MTPWRPPRSTFSLRPYGLTLLGIETLLIGAHFLWGEERFFNLDKEFNLSSWFSSIQLLTLGLVALVTFHVERRHEEAAARAQASWGWGLLALVFFYLSCDEALVLHEQVLRTEVQQLLPPDSLWQSLPPWQLVFAPAIILLVSFLLVFFLQRFRPFPELLLFATGGIGLWVLALGLEGVATPVFIAHNLYQVEVALEEGAEMLGATLLLFAMARYALGVGSQGWALPQRSRLGWAPGRGWALVGGLLAVLILTPVTIIWWVTTQNAAWLYRHTGAQFLEAEAYPKALLAYRQALAQAPQDVEALRGLGFTYYQLQQYREAIAAYRRAVSLRAGDAQLLTDLALVLHHAGQEQEAAVWYQKALAADPQYEKALSNLQRLPGAADKQERINKPGEQQPGEDETADTTPGTPPPDRQALRIPKDIVKLLREA